MVKARLSMSVLLLVSLVVFGIGLGAVLVRFALPDPEWVYGEERSDFTPRPDSYELDSAAFF